jgi:signal transduction histidine kinase
MNALTPLRVLVIEDCLDDHELLVLKLREAGFAPAALRVDTIRELEDALLEPWQIVVSDFDLPGFNGLRALELVRQRNPQVPFLIVSGVIDEEQAVAAMQAGAQDYFSKGKLARLGPAVSRELREAEERRSRAEAQAQLDRDRDLLRHDRIRFVDVMSHELRTPLNNINLAATMLARYNDRMDGAARAGHIREIQEAVSRMTRLIDKVLLTSRLELRSWDLRADSFDPAEWSREFLDQNFGEQKQRIRLKLEKLPPRVAMDQRVIEIAVQNLLSNALKYSPPDSPVDLEIGAAEPGWITFLVRDTGIGIPQQDMPHIFDSFYRGSNVEGIPGTGLGLALVKSCVDLHSGTLSHASHPGGGTCISMSLPDWLAHVANVRETEAIEA